MPGPSGPTVAWVAFTAIGPRSTIPLSLTTRHRYVPPGSPCQENGGLTRAVEAGGRAVIVGAGGATVSTAKRRVASAPGSPPVRTCLTPNT